MDLGTVTDELYAGGLDAFTPQRTALAKAARAEGDKTLAAEIGKLRKPSTSAWAINMLVRTSPDEVDRLLDLGAAFRQAQDDLDGAELRGLTRQRQALIGAVVESARDVANDLEHPISDAIATEVEQTFRAAMADPDAASAVRGGALTTAISASGLGSLKISDVAASTATVLEVVRAPAQKRGRTKKASPSAGQMDEEDEDARQEREQAAEAAADLLELAEQAAMAAASRLTAAGEVVERANARRAELSAALDELRELLSVAEQELAAADDLVADAEQDQEAAKTAAADADQAVKDARAAIPSSP